MSDELCPCARGSFGDYEGELPDCPIHGRESYKPLSEPTQREQIITELAEKGMSRERAEAVLDLLKSGLQRRGLMEGEPLSQEQLCERLDVLLEDGDE